MVSKPTGRPVGRPRKPKRPRRPQAGRPPQTFRNDPDRYAVALLDAMLALELGSERACALGIAVWQVGIEATPRQIVSDRHVLTSWLRKPTRTGALAATLEGRALTLRSKQRRRCSGEDGAWRTAMASSFMLVLGACNLESVKSTILARAESVGEGEFAECVMLPMWVEKFAQTSAPEFSGNFASTQDVR